MFIRGGNFGSVGLLYSCHFVQYTKMQNIRLGYLSLSKGPYHIFMINRLPWVESTEHLDLSLLALDWLDMLSSCIEHCLGLFIIGTSLRKLGAQNVHELR